MSWMDKAVNAAQAANDSAAASEAAERAALTAEVDAWARPKLADWCRQVDMPVPSHPKVNGEYRQAAGDAPPNFYVTYRWTEQGIHFQGTAIREFHSFSVGLYLNDYDEFTITNTVEQLGAAILRMRKRQQR